MVGLVFGEGRYQRMGTGIGGSVSGGIFSLPARLVFKEIGI